MHPILRDTYRALPFLQSAYRATRRVVSRQQVKWQVRQCIRNGSPLKIVIGANRKFQSGWIPTEEYNLNLLSDQDWARYFQPASVTRMVSEHVWEHLTAEQGLIAARLCFHHLKSGGCLRVAVPDALFPSKEYRDYCKPGGHGPSAWDHKMFFDYRSMSELFRLAGFSVTPLEWYDETGVFHITPWELEDGQIKRSTKFPDPKRFDGLPYTSLILDAVKP